MGLFTQDLVFFPWGAWKRASVRLNTRSRVQKNTRSRVHLVCREVRAMHVEAGGNSNGLVGVWGINVNVHEISCAESIRRL